MKEIVAHPSCFRWEKRGSSPLARKHFSQVGNNSSPSEEISSAVAEPSSVGKESYSVVKQVSAPSEETSLMLQQDSLSVKEVSPPSEEPSSMLKEPSSFIPEGIEINKKLQKATNFH